MRVSPECLQTAIGNFYEANPSALLMGSLGRSAVFGRIMSDSELEFTKRGEHPLWRDPSSPRDLDFIVPGLMFPAETGAFEVDTVCFSKEEVRISKEGEDWWVVSDMHKYSARLHPAIMEPKEAKTVYDIDCLVPPLQTFQRLGNIPILTREKDKIANALVEVALRRESEVLPDELYKPIDDLKAISNSGAYPRLMRVYNQFVPLHVRLALRPKIQDLKQIIISRDLQTEQSNIPKVRRKTREV